MAQQNANGLLAGAGGKRACPSGATAALVAARSSQARKPRAPLDGEGGGGWRVAAVRPPRDRVWCASLRPGIVGRQQKKSVGRRLPFLKCGGGAGYSPETSSNSPNLFCFFLFRFFTSRFDGTLAPSSLLQISHNVCNQCFEKNGPQSGASELVKLVAPELFLTKRGNHLGKRNGYIPLPSGRPHYRTHVVGNPSLRRPSAAGNRCYGMGGRGRRQHSSLSSSTWEIHWKGGVIPAS